MSSGPLSLDRVDTSFRDMAPPEIAGGLLHLLQTDPRDKVLEVTLHDLANWLSPHHLTEVYRIVARSTSEQDCNRVARHARQWQQFLRRGGAVFDRQEVFAGATLFRSAVTAEARPALVCFTGLQNQMFMAICRFLDLLGRHPIDVIVLTTDDATFGRWNLNGAGSFAASLALLRAALGARGIRPRAYMGTSAGGEAAVAAALMDGTASGIMFGGRFYKPGRKIPLSAAGTPFAPTCACWQKPKPQIYSIFGGEQPIDVENNRRLARLLPQMKCYPIPKDNQHNAMATLAGRQKLRTVMDLVAQVAGGVTVSFDLVTTL
jgi:hypothetical protein